MVEYPGKDMANVNCSTDSVVGQQHNPDHMANEFAEAMMNPEENDHSLQPENQFDDQPDYQPEDDPSEDEDNPGPVDMQHKNKELAEPDKFTAEDNPTKSI